MKNIILKLKKRKSWLDLILVVSVVIVTFFVWRGILNQSIEGEGFNNFDPPRSPGGILSTLSLTNDDNMSLIFTFVLGLIFRGNMQGYMTPQLIVIILLAVLEYFVIKSITKSRLIALMATIYFTVNSSGNYQIYARGHFHWFTQRSFELFPFLLSILFLSKFFNSEKYRHYLLSFLFFLIALLTSHFATLLLFFYPSFLFIMAVTKKVPIKRKVFYLLLSLPFIIINYLMVSGTIHSSLNLVNPANTSLPLIKQAEEYVLKVSHQLAAVTIPFNLLTLIARTFNSSEIKIFINEPFSSITLFSATIPYEALKASIIKLSVPVYIFYGGVIWFLYKKRSPQFYFVLALFFTLIGDLFITAYINRFDIYTTIFESRYFYIPGFIVGIIFACFIYNLIPNKLKRGARPNIFKLALISVLLLFWIFINFRLIHNSMKSTQYKYTGERRMFEYLKGISPNLPEGSIVLLPYPFMPGTEAFLKLFYENSSKTVKYFTISDAWQKDIPDKFNPQNLFVFNYSAEFKRGGNAELNKINIIDESINYRKQLVGKSSGH